MHSRLETRIAAIIRELQLQMLSPRRDEFVMGFAPAVGKIIRDGDLENPLMDVGGSVCRRDDQHKSQTRNRVAQKRIAKAKSERWIAVFRFRGWLLVFVLLAFRV